MSGASLAGRAVLAALWFGFWFFGVFPLGLHALAGGRFEPAPVWLLAPGLALLAAATAFVVDGVRRFLRDGRGTHAPFHPPERLVVAGPYRWVRNPLYLAYDAFIVGEALCLASPAIAAYALAFAALAHGFVVWVEEPGLRRRFGAEYDRYRADVPRWRPRAPSAAPSRSERSCASNSASSSGSKTPS